MERAFHFNVTAPFTLTKLAARRMVDTSGRGAIVNISSRSASMTQTSFAAYGAVKAALDRLTRNMAPELAPRVRLNALDVGGVATRSLEIVLTDDGLRSQFLAGTPMGRPGEPEDIACAVVYLVSDAASWVTGKVFEIDGGTEAPAMTVPVPPLEPSKGWSRTAPRCLRERRRQWRRRRLVRRSRSPPSCGPGCARRRPPRGAAPGAPRRSPGTPSTRRSGRCWARRRPRTRSTRRSRRRAGWPP